MADRALTEAALRQGLADIRLPGTAPGGALAEGLAAFALGLAVAVILGLCVRLVTRRRQRAPTLDQRMTALREQPDDARRLGLLHLLAKERPEVLAGWSDRLYRPDQAPGIPEIEAALGGAAPGRGGAG